MKTPIFYANTMAMLLLSFVLGAPALAGDQAESEQGTLKALPGYQVELLYQVPQEQGSWVSLACDPKGRIIASPQFGKPLYRITPPDGENPIRIEPLSIDLGGAQGLLYAFDSLYVVVNAEEGTGLYRARDTDGDDQFDEVRLLREITGSTLPSEHGPHAVVLGPDRQSLYMIAGNTTHIPAPEKSLIPGQWREDRLLPRADERSDGRFSEQIPGGWVCRTDPQGQSFELVSIGSRNPYDLAFNADGELFTFDSDMEWDMGLPWYRPTRVTHVTSGSDFGWRAGSNKWPEYYLDSLPSVVDIGASSPTGLVFGYGAKFPAKYQHALFMGDWSFGKIYAIHLEPKGASYTATFETFLTGAPLAVTDIVIHPIDGAMYFAVGGRGSASALYRVRYVGSESTDPVELTTDAGASARAERHKIEALHTKTDPSAVEAAWPYLSHSDRFLRYAARVAIEHQPVQAWQDRALAEKNPRTLLAAMAALARQGDAALQPKIVDALGHLEWDSMTESDQLDWLRAHMLAFARLGEPAEEIRRRVLERLSPLYPADGWRQNRELSEILWYLNAPDFVSRTLDLLAHAATQEDRFHYLQCLSRVEVGWTLDQRHTYFEWLNRMVAGGGGVWFGPYLEIIKDRVTEQLNDDEKETLADLLKGVPVTDPYADLKHRPFVKEWAVEELLPMVESGMNGRDFEQGRTVFSAAACFKCHRFNGEGGFTAPDLTGVGGRYDTRTLLESIIEPSKVISDQYASVEIIDKNGKTYVGMIGDVNAPGVEEDYFQAELLLMTDLANPAALVRIPGDSVEEIRPSPTSMMPTGLVNNFTQEEILNLVAYLRSGGDPNYFAFQRK